MTLLDVLAEHSQPLLRARPPLVERAPAEVVGQLGISRDATNAEQAHRCLEVTSRDAERLGDGLHAVVERDAGVPDRIPDLVRDLGDVRDAPPPPMHEDHVDVASRSELTSAVAPDRDERAVGGVGEEANQELVYERGERSGEVTSLQGLVGEQRGAPLAEQLRVRRFPSPQCERGRRSRSR